MFGVLAEGRAGDVDGRFRLSHRALCDRRAAQAAVDHGVFGYSLVLTGLPCRDLSGG